MTRRDEIQASLHAWRTAERALGEATDGHAAELRAAIGRHRDEYHRLTTEAMLDNIDRLKEAEMRRASATPSTPEFHAAVRETQDIAADIWEEARRG